MGGDVDSQGFGLRHGLVYRPVTFSLSIHVPSQVHEEDFVSSDCGLWRGLARRPVTLPSDLQFDLQGCGLLRSLERRPVSLRTEASSCHLLCNTSSCASWPNVLTRPNVLMLMPRPKVLMLAEGFR